MNFEKRTRGQDQAMSGRRYRLHSRNSSIASIPYVPWLIILQLDSKKEAGWGSSMA